MNHELRMAELLCTRLCHDLTGPIGAVNNGAEFLAEEGFNMQNQAVDLIVSSAFSAVSRLQFYRMAYGNVKDGGEVSLSDKQKLATDFFSGSKTTVDWPDSAAEGSGVSVSVKMARLIFNLLIMASGALIRGGAPLPDGEREVLVAPPSQIMSCYFVALVLAFYLNNSVNCSVIVSPSLSTSEIVTARL